MAKIESSQSLRRFDRIQRRERPSMATKLKCDDGKIDRVAAIKRRVTFQGGKKPTLISSNFTLYPPSSYPQRSITRESYRSIIKTRTRESGSCPPAPFHRAARGSNNAFLYKTVNTYTPRERTSPLCSPRAIRETIFSIGNKTAPGGGKKGKGKRGTAHRILLGH